MKINYVANSFAKIAVKCYGKSGARVKMDKCFEKGQKKYPFKTKKMVKLLKDKRP